MTAVFDTNILIDFLNGVPEAAQLLEEHEERIISILSWVEVLVGARTAEREASARRLLRGFIVLDVTSMVAEEAVRIRQATRMKLPDALILATARSVSLPLNTRNTKDFDEAEGSVVVPYRVGAT